jgi:pimeloyl-ACP methyl ester carboxylesterase
MWPEVVDFFSTRYEVIAPEQLGHGHTVDDPSRPLHYHAMAEDTVELLRQLGVTSAYFVGWSDGGNVGLDIAVNHPALVAKLVTSGANIHPGSSDPEGAAWIHRLKAACGAGDKPWRDCWGPDVKEAYGREAPDPSHWPAFIDRVKAMWLAEPDMKKGDLAKIKARALIVAGDHDLVATAETMEIFQSIPGAALWIVPESTHNVVRERAKLWNETVAAFLAEEARARRP